MPKEHDEMTKNETKITMEMEKNVFLNRLKK